MNATAELAARGLSLAYGSVRALDGVDLTLRGGEVHVLLGANGAGKSSLVGALLGLVQPDAGQITLDGVERKWRGPADALAAGIGVVHQHFQLVDAFDVAENLLLGGSRRAWTKRAARDYADGILAAHHCPLRAEQRVADLSVGERQSLEITRALHRARRFLLLDEPTAALAPHENQALWKRVASLRDRGLGVLWITHKLDEVERIADRVSVMREGRVVDHSVAGKRSREELARLVIGADDDAPSSLPAKRGSEREPAAAPTRSRPSLLVKLERARGPGFGPASLQVERGEVVGIAGVDGNGQRPLCDAILGLLSLESGTLERCAETISCIRGDRRRGGLALDLSITDNTLLHRRHLRRWWFPPAARERAAERLLEGYRLQARDLAQCVRELSGGNQQKVVVARELGSGAPLILAENPTRGLDPAVTTFVRRTLADARERGLGVLLFSTDLEEILELSDRVFVAERGRLLPAAASRAAVAAAMARPENVP